MGENPQGITIIIRRLIEKLIFPVYPDICICQDINSQYYFAQTFHMVNESFSTILCGKGKLPKCFEFYSNLKSASEITSEP